MTSPSVKKRCTNNMAAKAREIVETLDKVCEENSPHRPSMVMLFGRGAFRHDVDVAFARIALERGKGLDEIEDHLHKTYRDDVHHRCDPVYPA